MTTQREILDRWQQPESDSPKLVNSAASIMLSPCPFCTRSGKRVNAHIIPRAFFEDISIDGSVLKQREIGAHPKRLPIGVYDDEIWCQSCEQKYGKYDDYAIDILRTPLEKFDPLHHAYELAIEKPKELKLFFIALLWRASTSNKRLFNNVSIDSFSGSAKKLLTSGSAESREDFSTIISFSGNDEKLIADPVKVRHSGVLFYRFFLGRFTADIKVSRLPTPKELQHAVIGHDQVLAIIRVERNMSLVHSTSRIAKFSC